MRSESQKEEGRRSCYRNLLWDRAKHGKEKKQHECVGHEKWPQRLLLLPFCQVLSHSYRYYTSPCRSSPWMSDAFFPGVWVIVSCILWSHIQFIMMGFFSNIFLVKFLWIELRWLQVLFLEQKLFFKVYKCLWCVSVTHEHNSLKWLLCVLPSLKKNLLLMNCLAVRKIVVHLLDSLSLVIMFWTSVGIHYICVCVSPTSWSTRIRTTTKEAAKMLHEKEA